MIFRLLRRFFRDGDFRVLKKKAGIWESQARDQALKRTELTIKLRDMLTLAMGCKKHPAYRAIRDPRTDCIRCRECRSASLRLKELAR